MTRTDPGMMLELRGWYDDLPAASRPEWDDVEVAARLGVRDRAGLDRLVLLDAGALHRVLSDLLDIVGPSPKATATPSTPDPPAPKAGTDEPGELELALSTLRGAAAVRLRSLIAWRAERDGLEVAGITDKNVLQLAQSGTDPRVWSRLGALAGFRKELVALLERAEAEPEAGPPAPPEAPAEVPAPTPEPVPAPTSAAAPVAAPAPAPPAPVTKGPVDPNGFAGYAYGADDVAGPPPVAVQFSATDQESLRLSWSEAETSAAVQLFRVQAHQTFLPDDSPDIGDTITATTACEAVDEDVFSSPVRHVAVWLYEGASIDQAKGAHPRLHATGVAVMPVRDLDVREDEGTVIGQWTAMQGLRRVDVFRVPIQIARLYTHYNAGDQLDAGLITQGGFQDPHAQPGMEYEYRVVSFAEGREDGSPYVARTVRLEAVIRPVEDLTVTPHTGSEGMFDLSWTPPPQGRVEIYRSESPPASGIDLEVITRSALDRQGLTPAQLLRRGTSSIDGRDSMVEVPWPKGWSRAYFTPATVLDDDHIHVGPSQVLVRAGKASQVSLIERVDEQFLTFAWPDGAATVKVFQGPPNTPLGDISLQTALQELGEQDYRKLGGVHLPNPLPGEGCSVHLVATTYSQKRATHGEPVTLQYPGLLRIRYDVRSVGQPPGRLFGGRSARVALSQVLVQSDQAASNLPLVLVHHQHRLPLHPGDGQELERRSMNLGPGVEMVFSEGLSVAGRGGYVRLFADVGAEVAHRVAVLDPSVASLRCE